MTAKSRRRHKNKRKYRAEERLALFVSLRMQYGGVPYYLKNQPNWKLKEALDREVHAHD